METERHRWHMQQYPVGTRVDYTYPTPPKRGTVIGHECGTHVSSIVVRLAGSDQVIHVGLLYLRKV